MQHRRVRHGGSRPMQRTMPPDPRTFVLRSVTRLEGDDVSMVEDVVAVEEPLEIQVAPADGAFRSVAVVMRTPDEDGSADEELALGFLRTEGVIRSVDDVVRIGPCTTPASREADGNVLQIRLASGIRISWEQLTRHVFSASSCGVCGKATLEAVARALPSGHIDHPLVVDAAVLSRLVDALADQQVLFAATGGTHAALLASCSGAVHFVREDVGRHNAVDKVLGAALRARLPLSDAVLVVSGRVAFELVQKCAAAGVGLIAGVGAPTSLAADLGTKVGVGVVGFLGTKRMNLYGSPRRVCIPPRRSLPR
jgi:FdhD protein